jgi:hypothetical protein
MRRFFATTCTALALLLATPVHAQPLAGSIDVESWLDGLASWFLELVSADKDGETDPPADPPADDTSSTTPPPDDARGSICGDG